MRAPIGLSFALSGTVCCTCPAGPESPATTKSYDTVLYETKQMAIPSAIYFFPRRVHVFWTALLVYFVLKTTQILNRLLRRDPASVVKAWVHANTRAARLILRTATRRRGLWIKCCQYVAARADALPEEYSTVLSKSLDDCPPTPPNLVRALVNAELAKTEAGLAFGQSVDVDDLFVGFDPASPIASASIAQVHVATEKATGTKVVLKVQHPGIRRMLLQDLIDLSTLLRLLAGANPKYDMRPVMNAWIDMVPLETDFVHERSNLDAVRTVICQSQAGSSGKLPAHLRCSSYVPRPLPHLSTDKVFVMEFIDGARVSDVYSMSDNPMDNKPYVDRSRLINDITKSFGLQLFVCDVFSGDPHPGNFLVRNLESGGQAVLLDFGICVPVTRELRLGFARLILAALHNDTYSLIKALREIGVQLNRTDPSTSLDVIRFLFRTTAPREEARSEQDKFVKDLSTKEKEADKNDGRHGKSGAKSNEANVPSLDDQNKGEDAPDGRSRTPQDSFPGHLVFFFRSLGMLRGLATSLGVRHSYLDALRPYAEYALFSDCPMHERIVTPLDAASAYASGESGHLALRMLQLTFPRLYERGMLLGMQVAVYKDGEKVLDVAAGVKGRDNPRPVSTDMVFNSFSTTKGAASIVFAIVQEQYNIYYDDFVVKYWPEYGQAGKEQTTIAHILTHSAGLARTLPSDLTMLRIRDDFEGIIRHFEEAAPAHIPGERVEYHAISFGWLVAALIQKITGRSFSSHLEELASKLGVQDECFCGNLPDDLVEDSPSNRVATLASYFISDLQQNATLTKRVSQAQQQQNNEGVEISGSQGTTSGKGDGNVGVGQDGGGDDATGMQAMFEGNNNTETGEDGGGGKQDVMSSMLDDIDTHMKATDEGGNSADNTKLKDQIPVFLLDLNSYNDPVLRSACLPSANGHFSARALAKLYSLIATPSLYSSVLPATRVAAMCEARRAFDYRGRRAWGAGLTLYDCIDPHTRETIPNAAVGHGGIGGSMAIAIPSHGFSIAVTVNKLNVLSIAAGIVIATVMQAFQVPIPEAYDAFARTLLKLRKARMENDEGNIYVPDEKDEMAQLAQQASTEDVMRILVG